MIKNIEVAATLAILGLLFSAPQLLVRASDAPLAKNADNSTNVQLSVVNATPRQVEDTTEKAIIRDYSAAWKVMSTALRDNRSDQLDSAFIGVARDKLAQRIEQQKTSGLHTRLLDRGHKLDAIFYSPEGSAMQLHDTAQVVIQLMDGVNVVHSENAMLHYVTLMTVAEDRWKVRVLQAVP